MELHCGLVGELKKMSWKQQNILGNQLNKAIQLVKIITRVVFRQDKVWKPIFEGQLNFIKLHRIKEIRQLRLNMGNAWKKGSVWWSIFGKQQNIIEKLSSENSREQRKRFKDVWNN
jgi:hypothetical protein